MATETLVLDSIRKRWNLKLNVEKSKVIVFQRNTGMECRVCMLGQEMEIVQDFKYEGSKLNKDGSLESEQRRK